MTNTRRILREYGYKARKEKGQHFLTRESVLDRIAEAAQIEPHETVVEIGPGPGNLTRRLVRLAKRVIAVEIEHELAAMTRTEVRAENLEVMEADVLELDFKKLAPPGENLKVVANLPYNITTAVLFKLLEDHRLFSQLYLLVQKEVAERISARPGKKPYGILAARAGMLADAEVVLHVRPEAFSPRPKVDSALVRLSMLERPRSYVKDMDTYAKVIKAAFSQRRKKLKNSFGSAGLLSKDESVQALLDAGISPGRRAETVTVEEFARLSNSVHDRTRNA